MAQGGAAVAGSLSIRADLAEGADLIADPGALIVCQGSRVDVRLELALGAGPGAAVEWRELIVLGRTGLLVTVLDDDAARATRQLDDLCARARG